jgi:hypothetical protein
MRVSAYTSSAREREAQRERQRERVSAGVGIHVVCERETETERETERERESARVSAYTSSAPHPVRERVSASQRPNESAASAAEPRSEGEGDFALLHVQRRQLCEREQMGQAGGRWGGKANRFVSCISAYRETRIWRLCGAVPSADPRPLGQRSTAAPQVCQQLVKHVSS